VTHYVSTIKKITGFVILTAFFLSPAFAETANGGYGFTLSPYIGILYGHSEEIVYKESPNQNLYQSELLWDLKPLLYVGLGADFRPQDSLSERGLIAALSFKTGLPLRSGIIEDSDWDNLEPNYYLTRYSRHDVYSKTAILLDASAGYFWRFAGSLALSVYGEFSFMHFSWSGRDGYYQYASTNSEGLYLPWDSSLPKVYDVYNSLEVIRYMQNWFILSPGVSLDWDMNRLFSMKAFFNYSPLIYCADRDDHFPDHFWHRTYFDYLYFGHYLKSGGELILSPSQNISLSLSASYKRITGARGDTIYQSVRYKDEAGAGYSALDLGLAVKFRLK
jgi:outer membrane protease